MAKYVEVIEAGKGWTKVKDSDGNVFTIKGDRNWRNNNPGNIEYGKFAKANGAIGTDGRFAVFPDLATGEKARSTLQFESGSYKNLTIAQAIEKYAPRSENDTDAYIRAVTAGAGVSPDTKMSDLTPEQRQGFLQAQRRVEGFRVGSVYREDGTKVPPAEVPNGNGQTAVGTQIDLTGIPGGSHVIKSGETLSKIAARYGTSVQAIADANGIKDVNKIRAGASLTIPGQGKQTAQTRGEPLQSLLPQVASSGVMLPQKADPKQFVENGGITDETNLITRELMNFARLQTDATKSRSAPSVAKVPAQPTFSQSDALRIAAATASAAGRQKDVAANILKVLDPASVATPQGPQGRRPPTQSGVLLQPSMVAKPKTPTISLTEMMGGGTQLPMKIETPTETKQPANPSIIKPASTPNGGIGFNINLGDMLNGAKDAIVSGAQATAETVQREAPKLAQKAQDGFITMLLASPAVRGAIIDPIINRIGTDKPAGYGKGSSESVAASGKSMSAGDSFKGTSNSGKTYTVGQKYVNSRGQIVTAQADGSFR